MVNEQRMNRNTNRNTNTSLLHKSFYSSCLIKSSDCGEHSSQAIREASALGTFTSFLGSLNHADDCVADLG